MTDTNQNISATEEVKTRVTFDSFRSDSKTESFVHETGKPQTLAPVAGIKKALKMVSSELSVNQPIRWFSI